MKVGGKDFHLVKLIGAFIVMGATLMLLASVYKLLWVASIIESVNAGGFQQVTLELSGVSVAQTLQYGDAGTQMGLLLVPIAYIMFWAGVLVFGGMVYQSCCYAAMPGHAKEKRKR
jgi:hypothetical protein